MYAHIGQLTTVRSQIHCWIFICKVGPLASFCVIMMHMPHPFSFSWLKMPHPFSFSWLKIPILALAFDGLKKVIPAFLSSVSMNDS